MWTMNALNIRASADYENGFPKYEKLNLFRKSKSCFGASVSLLGICLVDKQIKHSQQCQSSEC